MELTFTVATKMPWWLGVIAALVIYFWLHSVATAPPPAPMTGLKQFGETVTSTIWQTIASVLQYLIPIVLLVGAAVSGYRQYQKAERTNQGAESLSWRSQGTQETVSSVSSVHSPSCPVCQAAMVRRIAKKGANSGGEFWGCSGYPKCRGTKDI